MVKLINENSVIKESAAEKDLYDDLYSYADRHWATSRWTKSNVEKYLKRQQDFRRMNDSDFYKVISKVNKAFKKDRKIKNDPYCDSSYKNESIHPKRRSRRMNEIIVPVQSKEEIDDLIERLENMWWRENNIIQALSISFSDDNLDRLLDSPYFAENKNDIIDNLDELISKADEIKQLAEYARNILKKN